MSISSFRPLLPEAAAQAPLLAQASALIAEGHRLESAAGQLGATLRPLLRSMNSYYTNKIEGQHTRPADIERALHQQFDADKKQARRQRLALAHIQAEEELEGALPSSRSALYAPEFVQLIHANLYRRLPSNEQVSDDGAKVVPGGFRRSGRVTAGQHLAPDAREIPELVGVWQKRYSALPGHEQAVVGAVCSHHRLLWVHPFLDGNGRAARLHTHLVLTSLGLTQGLWSPLRGMARQQETYYARLNNADLPKRNDLDGRGPRSEEELVAFASWLLELCLNQASFMRAQLSLDAFKGRLQDLLLSLAARPWSIGSESSVVKVEALEALHYTGDRRSNPASPLHGHDRFSAAGGASDSGQPASFRCAQGRDVARPSGLRCASQEPTLLVSAALARSRSGRRRLRCSSRGSARPGRACSPPSETARAGTLNAGRGASMTSRRARRRVQRVWSPATVFATLGIERLPTR